MFYTSTHSSPFSSILHKEKKVLGLRNASFPKQEGQGMSMVDKNISIISDFSTVWDFLFTLNSQIFLSPHDCLIIDYTILLWSSTTYVLSGEKIDRLVPLFFSRYN